MRVCYLIMMRLYSSTPVSERAIAEEKAAAVATENTGQGVSRSSMTAGGAHQSYYLYMSENTSS